MSILDGAIFKNGFEIKGNQKITLFEKTMDLKKVKLEAWNVEDGITLEQEQSFENLQKILSRNVSDIENAIVQYYLEVYKDSELREFYKENYDKDLFDGDLTTEKMQNELEDPVYVVINSDGKTVLYLAQQIEPDNGLAVVLLPKLKIQSQDEWF